MNLSVFHRTGMYPLQISMQASECNEILDSVKSCFRINPFDKITIAIKSCVLHTEV